MCDAQVFIDDLPPMPDFKLSYAPPPLREALQLFPPQHRLVLFKVLTAWSIRVHSPAYEPISPSTFLLAVPVSGDCYAATFNTRHLRDQRSAAPGSAALAFDLLNRARQRAAPELLHTIANFFVEDPSNLAFIREIEGECHTCVFIGALSLGQRRDRHLGAVAVPTAAREPLRSTLASGVSVPPYARAIYDGAVHQYRAG